jgi:hypothetical protein
MILESKMPNLLRLLGCTLLFWQLQIAGCNTHESKRPWPGGLPYAVDANGDGVEDMITFGGPITMLDGRNYQPLWERPDLDVPQYDGRRLGATARDAFIVARDRSLDVLELSTGRTRSKLALSDKVASLCADGESVFIGQIDAVRGLFDVRTGTLDKSAPLPARCARTAERLDACKNATAECESRYPSKNMMLSDGNAFVSVEFKEPGTPEVTVVLHDRARRPFLRVPFDPEGKRVDAVDLAGGMVFLAQSGTVTALDAKTGAVAWTSTCSSSSGNFLRATASRVYVQCDGPKAYKALRVLHHDTGAVLTELGDPRP